MLPEAAGFPSRLQRLKFHRKISHERGGGLGTPSHEGITSGIPGVLVGDHVTKNGEIPTHFHQKP